MNAELADLVERCIYLRRDGAIVWESILDKHVDRGRLKHILALVADNSNEERLDWNGVWDDLKAEGKRPCGTPEGGEP